MQGLRDGLSRQSSKLYNTIEDLLQEGSSGLRLLLHEFGLGGSSPLRSS